MAALKSSVTTLETLTAHHITSWNDIPCKGTPFDNIKYQTTIIQTYTACDAQSITRACICMNKMTALLRKKCLKSKMLPIIWPNTQESVIPPHLLF